MIWNSLLLIFPILILVAALRYYKNDGRWMNAFYRRMSFHDVARRLYVQLVMLLLILFQFIQIQTHISAIDTFIPLIITALLIRFSMAELVFYAIKRRKVMVSVCSLVLVGLFIPHCFSMAVALGILLVASIFYPSRGIRNMVESPDEIFSLTSIPGQLVANYY